MNNLFIVCFYYIYLTRATSAYRFSCSENEILERCRKPCQPTCQNSLVPGCGNYPCKPGCVCKPGRLRDEITGRCVSWRYCIIECPANEVPSTFGNACEQTCQYTRMQCSQIKWCVCRPGLLRDLISGRCISPEECSTISRCKENEVWTECSDENCRATCKRRKPKVCPTPCKPGCSCKDGYLWDACVKKCVSKLQCTPECDKNEDWCLKLPDYTATCQNILDSQCQNCNDPPPEEPRPGCICIKGFIWDEVSQQCVRLEECPTNTTSTTTTVASTTTTSTSIRPSRKSSTSRSTPSKSTTSKPSSTLSESSSTTETTATTSTTSSTSPSSSTSESTTSTLSESSSTTETTATTSTTSSTSSSFSTSESTTSISSTTSSTTESTTSTSNSTSVSPVLTTSTSEKSSVTSSSTPLTSSSTSSTSMSASLPSIEPVTVTPS